MRDMSEPELREANDHVRTPLSDIKHFGLSLKIKANIYFPS